MNAHAALSPAHVAIIMDGNGRWARGRGLPRVFGHREGVGALRRTVAAAIDAKISWLTVFGFSTENWKRPVTEVSELMGLLREFVKSDVAKLAKDGVRVRIIGCKKGLDADIIDLMQHAEAATAHGTRLNLNVAFNYGGQEELVHAARALAEQVAQGTIAPEAITADRFGDQLYTAGQPDIDLLIRTSGEQRISNFLLWQSAYAEFVFQDVLWPDYGPDHLRAALDIYGARERRFGASDPVDAAHV